MFVNVYKEDFIKAIEKAERVVPKKSSSPITESVLLTAKGNEITLTADNLVSGIVIEVDGKVYQEGEVLIDKSNFKLIKSLQGFLEIKGSEGYATIKGDGNRELKFTQLLPTDFPKTVTDAESVAFTITEKEFKDSLKIKKFASSLDARPVIKSLCIRNNRAVALDGYKMGLVDLNIDNECDKDLIIPLDAINELDRILDKKSEDKLTFSYGCNKEGEIARLKIEGNGYFYITRLIHGKYINIEQLTVDDFKTTVEANRKPLLDAVKFASEIAKDDIHNTATFNVADEFVLTAKSPGGEKQSSEVIFDSNIEGKEIKFALNGKFAIDVLSTITDGEVIMQINEAVDPVFIKGKETNSELFCVFPLRIE